MMEMFSPLLNDYSERFTTAHDRVLQQIHDEAMQSHAHAHMLSTHVQGKFLEMVSTIMRPKYILEIGTFVGYSAICLAKGLQEDGELHTLELRETDAATAKANFHRVDLDKKIHLHVGNALDIIPTLDIQWDLVFIDADKISYTQYYELVLPRLSDRGMIIADNVLFHGEVLEEPVKGKSAKAIQAFNQHVMDDERSEQVLVTMRDGLLLIRKKHN
ncbi:O-methyltransferase [Danxiaibacter flavus]|uniref:O-methyltransferase n=1 Tax=Danxiaibacter flavus TaxID=3049108 RepID=A0ABV3ZCP0_9BACT|nr:O-methyltransferase [Chitinophagaceae bacterium DXS]